MLDDVIAFRGNVGVHLALLYGHPLGIVLVNSRGLLDPRTACLVVPAACSEPRLLSRAYLAFHRVTMLQAIGRLEVNSARWPHCTHTNK